MTDSQGAQKFERSFSKVCPSVAGVLLDVSQACVHTYTYACKQTQRQGCWLHRILIWSDKFGEGGLNNSSPYSIGLFRASATLVHFVAVQKAISRRQNSPMSLPHPTPQHLGEALPEGITEFWAGHFPSV